jgi:hypothetical protein
VFAIYDTIDGDMEESQNDMQINSVHTFLPAITQLLPPMPDTLLRIHTRPEGQLGTETVTKWPCIAIVVHL